MDGGRDPFIEKFLSRIPSDAAASFSDAQLRAVKLAFGARSWGRHTIDFRHSFRLFWRHFYIVFLFGHERRTEDRLVAEGSEFGTLGNALITFGAILVILIPAMVALYVVKSLAGIDFFGGGEGGHGWWDELMRQIGILLD